MNSVDRDDPRPPSVQIADDLRCQVAEGRLAPGDRLPSGRTLANTYGVALMTAQSAVQHLKDEGLVYSTGRGYFVVDETKRSNISKDELHSLADERDLREEVADLRRRVETLERHLDQ